jgi:hypothetical protein
MQQQQEKVANDIESGEQQQVQVEVDATEPVNDANESTYQELVHAFTLMTEQPNN